MVHNEPILDMAILHRLARDVGKDTAMMLIGSLITEISNSETKLTGYLAAEDIALFENQAHALKSAARSFGAVKLGESCYALETAAKATRRAAIDQLMIEFKVIAAATLREFQRIEQSGF